LIYGVRNNIWGDGIYKKGNDRKIKSAFDIWCE
jgi:hypothetical protein